MISTDKVIQDMITAPARKINARVELYSGSTLLDTFKYTDRLKSFTVERAGESKFFGFGICQKVNVKVLDKNRELNITTANTLDISFGVGSDYVYTLPLFYVTEVHRDENTNELSITAYDAIYSAEKHTLAELGLTSYDIKKLATACASALGLPIRIHDEAASAFVTRYPKGANFDGTETLREVLNAIAEATQTIYYVCCRWELNFKRLNNDAVPALTIDKDNYFTLKSGENRRLAQITHTTELGDNVESKSAAIAASGTTQYIRDNPFWNLRNDIDILLDAAIEDIGGLTINQFECAWRGNFLLEIGEKIAFVTKDNKTVTSFLLDDTISYNGVLSENTKWQYEDNETETDVNPSNIGDALKKTFARVDKVNNNIKIITSDISNQGEKITEIEANLDGVSIKATQAETAAGLAAELGIQNHDRIGALEITAGNIQASVTDVQRELAESEESTNSRLTEIENKSILNLTPEAITAEISSVSKELDAKDSSMNDRVTSIENNSLLTLTKDSLEFMITEKVEDKQSITTSNGFKFDESGLNIYTSETDINTTIKNDGMYIEHNSGELLTANSEGVNARNLHATTYLFIGKNTRLEDYDNGSRTGCFWVGR